jgi:hypothetical protein
MCARRPDDFGPFLFVAESTRELRQMSTLDMSKKSNSTKRRKSSRSPSPKCISSVGGMANPGAGATRCTATAGESFPSAMIDLVGDPANSCGLNLLLWDGSRAIVAPRISYRRSTYEPIALEPSVIRTLPWPKCPIPYGSTKNLFDTVLELITQHVEIQETSARLLTYFVFSTWFPDRLSLSPGFAILGPADSDGVQLLRLLRCVCRRSILLAEASQTSLLSLPLQLSPTLLMHRPLITRQLRNFLSTSNRRGLGTVKGGKVLEVCCPKAIYFGMDEIPQSIASVMIQVALLSSTSETPVLEEVALNDVSAELQGKMLEYRLASYSKVKAAHLRGMNLTHQTREIAMNLAACIVDDAELASGVVPLLKEQDDHVRGQPDRKLDAAILGAVLACLHEKKSDRVQVKDVTVLANTLLRTQGEIVEYRPEEVGHRLDGFSLSRTRQNEGMFLLLGRDTSRLVHRLALGFGVARDVDSRLGCPDCQLLGRPAPSTVV